MAGCLTLHTPDTAVIIEPAAGVEVSSIAGPGGSCGGVTSHRDDGSVVVRAGPMHIGQTRDVVVELKSKAIDGAGPVAHASLVDPSGRVVARTDIHPGAGNDTSRRIHQ